ncbi:MAG: dienelactone hydrolase family protein [Thiohalophilus sp.]|nr:dienelactone hydrolase family protein [Thiohalophilus sp.]MDZ7804736.1 dienelactone hydrolase family protein [Thiohalophilus sp.]
MNRYVLGLCLGLAAISAGAHDEPQIEKELWWSEAWWNEGVIEAPRNYEVVVEEHNYESDGVTIPAMLARPKQAGKFPAVLFQHGRRGLDDLIRRHVRRLAARGFVVLAPDIYQAHFIGTHPIEHDYALEKDVNRGVDALLSRQDISSDRICLYSHTRGGYYTLKVATTFGRQKSDVACYVSYYPHLQDPNAPEPLQVYGFAGEVEQLEIPVLVFIGEQEQYQRRRVIESSIESLQKDGKPAHLIVYPGVGRGFDFRPESVRTFADELASKDAIQRAADFMRRHLRAD